MDAVRPGVVEPDVERLNDRLAREHPIDDYYECSPLPIRFVEGRRLATSGRSWATCRDSTSRRSAPAADMSCRCSPRRRLTAIDVSDAYLSIARRNLAGYQVRFVKGEVDKLDLPPEQFDRVICTEVLEHVVDPEAVLAASRSCCVLRASP